MKRSTIILLVAAAALAAVTFFVTSRGPEGPPAGLSVEGYATAADLAAEKARGLLEGPLEIAHEIDEIVLERPGGAVRLVRDGAGTDATWRLTEPVAATAVKYQVEKITGLFKTDTVSVFTTRVAEGDLALYDLEPERRVGLTLKSRGEVYRGVDLYIGRAEKGDGAESGGGDAEVDTWVMARGDTSVVHRITGKDLRAPALESLDGLRDKKVFTITAEDLTEVAVTSPDGRRVVLTGLRTELEPPPGEEGEDGSARAEPEVVVSWKLSEPDGVMPDTSAQNLPRGLANLRAKEFVPTADAPGDALAGAVWRIEAKVHEGEAIALTIGDGAGSGGDEVWARVEGADELMKLNTYSANQLRKTVEELRDKKALDLDRASITGLVLAGADGPIALTRDGDAWRFTTPAVRYPADPNAVLGSVSRITVARWARADELEAARAALTTPAVRGAVVAGEATHQIAFSAKLEGTDDAELEGKRWGIVGEPTTAEPFLVPDFAATRFETTVGALRSKKILGERGRDDVRAVEITQAGGAESIRVEASPGGGAPRLADLPEGGAANDGQLQTLFATATGLSAKAFVAGRDRAALGLNDPALRVALSLTDGGTVTVLVSAQDDGTDPYATVEGGPLDGSLFTLNTYQVKNLQKPRADLLQ